jgi:MFS family permease
MSKTSGRRAATLGAMRGLLILLTGQAMASMDGSILAVTAPSLRADLHASDAQLQLVVAMYTVAFAALVVTGARLGDVLGRRRAFVGGLAAFTVASLVGGLAPGAPALIAARGLQGAAAALMTPQVLTLIQLGYAGEARARAVGAYSLVLAVGVAAGQILGGLVVGAHLLAAAWRPALLLNAPVGAALLLAGRRGLPDAAPGPRTRLDLGGVALLGVALGVLVLALTVGRQAGWPVWVWPALALSGAGLGAFAGRERSLPSRGRVPLFDLEVLRVPGVAAGVGAVVVVMGAYAGFLLALTLHLQDGLGFTPLRAGLTFAVYAAGFAAASLGWPRAGGAWRSRLPVLGPAIMGTALLAVGLIAARGGWPVAATAPLLFTAGVGHACSFSPLAHRLVAAVGPTRAAEVSGLVLTASLIGSVLGTAGLVGVYLAAAPAGSGPALARTTWVLAAALAVTSACAARAVAPGRRWRPRAGPAQAPGP